jgi:hypothetical protein
MSTSVEVREARHFKEYLTSLRREETYLVKRLAGSRMLHEESPEVTAESFAVIEKSIGRSLDWIREAIVATKATLATKVHINNKSENRKARQAAAKRAKGKSR